MNSNIEDIYNNSNNNLNKIKNLLADCEKSADLTLEQLEIDKEKLIKINKNIEKVDEQSKQSRKILNNIEKTEIKRKVITSLGLGLTTIGAVIATIFLIKKK